MMDNKVKVGDQYYSPLLIKVEYKQDLPKGVSDIVKAEIIAREDKAMMERLHNVIDEHMHKHTVIRGGHLQISRIELMILKPIENGE